jgi:hypothetical protein
MNVLNGQLALIQEGRTNAHDTGCNSLEAYPLQMPKMGKPHRVALARVMSKTAAAPSVVLEEFPAVVTPFSLKTGLSCFKMSRLMPKRHSTNKIGMDIVCNLSVETKDKRESC